MTKNILYMNWRSYNLWRISSLLLLGILILSCKKDPIDDTPPIDNKPDSLIPYDKVPALAEMAMYEVNFMAFGPAGNISNLSARLDSIKSLGVNVLWLMPIFPEGVLNGVGSPYAVANYTELNPDLGDLSEFKKLVNDAHSKEMAVIIDWVANHTAWDNPWIDNADWYTQDTEGNILSPAGTNWSDVADLNFTNQEMRLEMISSMKYWITETNIDGFRCDAADMVPYSFWKQAMDTLKKLPGRNLILLAEGSRTDHFTAGFQITYAWDFQTALKKVFSEGQKASTLFQVNTSEYSTVPYGKEKLRYITNHDIYAWDGSVVSQFTTANASVTAFAITAFLNGVPLIYSGQDVAEPNTISFFTLNPVNWDSNPSVTAEYRSIMNVRKNWTSVINSELITYANDEVVIYKHIEGVKEILIIANTRNHSVVCDLPVGVANQSWNDLKSNTSIILSDAISLAPFEFKLLGTN